MIFLYFFSLVRADNFCAENNKPLNGHFAHCICQKFYHCDVLDKTVVKDCAPGTVWDDAIKNCNWPSESLTESCCDLRVENCDEICSSADPPASTVAPTTKEPTTRPTTRTQATTTTAAPVILPIERPTSILEIILSLLFFFLANVHQTPVIQPDFDGISKICSPISDLETAFLVTNDWNIQNDQFGR